MPAGCGHKGSKAPPKKKAKVQPESRVPFSVVMSGQSNEHGPSSNTVVVNVSEAQAASSASTESLDHDSSSSSRDFNTNLSGGTVTMSIGNVESLLSSGNLIMNTGQLNIHPPEVTYHNMPTASPPLIHWYFYAT